MRKLCSLIFIIAALSVSAQGYQVNLQGQVQQGMGSAGSAFIQDASSLFYNPGGLVMLESNQVIVGMTPTFSNVTFTEDSTFLQANTESPVGTPFAVYGSFKLKDSSDLAFGLGVYTPFGSTVQWQEEWMGRFVLTRIKLMSIFFQPTVSYRINEKLGIGAGFVYSYGQVNLQKDIPIQFQDGSYANAELNGTGSGFGFNAGVYYAPMDLLSFGVSYRSKVDMNLSKGTATFTVPESLSDKFPSGDFTSSLPLPSVITGSFKVHPTEKLNIVGDVNYASWSAYDTLAFDYAENTESLEDTKSARMFENTFAFRFGGQYALNDAFQVRLGMTYALTPVQDGYLTPETPDANRINLTAGVGYRLNDNFNLDASVLVTQFSRHDKNLETNLSGRYETMVVSPGLSLTYQF